ncbi:MAG TPA: hypothetical protein VLV48_04720 [Thermoanaerobaculia bacterium]|nr:hypothetical protein [Thermoanaerobaculia bacterium]
MAGGLSINDQRPTINDSDRIRRMTTPAQPAPPTGQKLELLQGVIRDLLESLKRGDGDGDKRRQVEEWLRILSEKYPEFRIESGLRDYYLAEAKRLTDAFTAATDLTEKLNLGRSVESYLDRAVEYARRAEEAPRAAQS